MALAQRIESLQAKRAALKAALHAEEGSSWHDEGKIVRLKRQNLKLKDEIFRLRLVAEGCAPPGQGRADTG